VHQFLEQIDRFDVAAGIYLGSGAFGDEVQNAEQGDIPATDQGDTEIMGNPHKGRLGVGGSETGPQDYGNGPDPSDAMADYLKAQGFNDISVRVVPDDPFHHITFVDDEGDVHSVILGTDPEHGDFALSHDEESGEELPIVDLNYLNPMHTADGGIDMSKPAKWLNKTALVTLLAPAIVRQQPLAGESVSLVSLPGEPYDEGFISDFRDKYKSRVFKQDKNAMYGGRTIRIPIIRKVRKDQLTKMQALALERLTAKAAEAKAYGQTMMSFKRRTESADDDAFTNSYQVTDRSIPRKKTNSLACPSCGNYTYIKNAEGKSACANCGFVKK